MFCSIHSHTTGTSGIQSGVTRSLHIQRLLQTYFLTIYLNFADSLSTFVHFGEYWCSFNIRIKHKDTILKFLIHVTLLINEIRIFRQGFFFFCSFNWGQKIMRVLWKFWLYTKCVCSEKSWKHETGDHVVKKHTLLYRCDLEKMTGFKVVFGSGLCFWQQNYVNNIK